MKQMGSAIVIRCLLRLLNSRWLNQSPCEYGYINNVDAFSLSNLESEERMRPGVTVETILREAEQFRCCPMKAQLQVVEGDRVRDANIWDVHELRNLATEKKAEGAKGRKNR